MLIDQLVSSDLVQFIRLWLTTLSLTIIVVVVTWPSFSFSFVYSISAILSFRARILGIRSCKRDSLTQDWQSSRHFRTGFYSSTSLSHSNMILVAYQHQSRTLFISLRMHIILREFFRIQFFPTLPSWSLCYPHSMSFAFQYVIIYNSRPTPPFLLKENVGKQKQKRCVTDVLHRLCMQIR